MRIRLHASYHHRVSRAVLTRQELQLSHYGLPPLELRIAPTSSSSRRNPPLYHRRAAKRYGPFSPHVPRCCSILDRLIANAYAKRRTPVPDEHVRSPIFTALRLSYHNPSRVALTDHVGCPTRLFTWNTQDLCLVFRWWHVTGPISLVLSLLGVVALSMGYEYVREVSRRYEARVDAAVTQGLSGILWSAFREMLVRREPDCESAMSSDDVEDHDESSSLLGTGRGERVQKNGHTGKAVLYGIQVFYSFFIMLLFMTYNGWVMLAVAVGASLGYMIWGGGNATKSVACH